MDNFGREWTNFTDNSIRRKFWGRQMLLEKQDTKFVIIDM